MPRIRRMLPLIAVIALAAAFAGCGSGGNGTTTPTVPSSIASELLIPLEAAKTADAAGDCAGVQTNAKTFAQQVAAIGQDQLEPALKQQLVAAAAKLKLLAQTDCTPTPTGASGAVGATEPNSPPSVPSTDSSTTGSTTDSTTTDPAVATKPDKGQRQPAKAKVDPAAKNQKPKKEKKPKKDNKHQKNGPPGPKGNPIHGGESGSSGGVTPGGGN